VRFAALEKQAISREALFAGQAIGAGDASLAGGEALFSLSDEAARRHAGLATARDLVRLEPLPARPVVGEGRGVAPPFVYQLPLDAPLAAGLGSVDANGIRSRGIGFANGRGVALIAPADGRIAFAGPYRRSDGVIIIDHGGGVFTAYHHLSQINVVTGQAVTQGEVIGLVGMTGLATGPHLHWELVVGGVNVDPMPWTLPGVAP